MVGADGRKQNLGGEIGHDSSQKIFFFETSNARGLFTWTGCTEICSSCSVFDFKDVTYSILGEIQTETFGSLSELITPLCLRLFDRLLEWIRNSNGRFDYPNNTEWARLQMIGYVNGRPDVARAVFPFRDGEPRSPGLVVSPAGLDGTLSVFTGNEKAYQQMKSLGRLQRRDNLSEAARLVHDYIEDCKMFSPTESNSIGGHIHIAIVTPSESTWIVPPLDPGTMIAGSE